MIQRFFGKYILAFLPTFGIQSNFVDGFEQIQSLLLLGIGNRRQFELQAIAIRRFGSTGVDGDGFEMFNQRAETIRRRAIFKACSGNFFTRLTRTTRRQKPGLGFQSTRQGVGRRTTARARLRACATPHSRPACKGKYAPAPGRRCGDESAGPAN